MSLDKDTVYLALVKSISLLVNENEGVVVEANDQKVIVANLQGEASAIPIEDVIADDDEIKHGQFITLKPHLDDE